MIIRRIKAFLRLLRKRIREGGHLHLIILSIIVGIGAALASELLIFLIKVIKNYSFPHGIETISIRTILAPALGGIVVAPLIHFFAKEAKGHGVPEVMISVLLREGRIKPRIALIKALASSVTIGSGGSAGREGPMVQIGAAIGSGTGYLLRLPTKHIKTLIACGAAGGIAAAFNAPMGGALFAMEVILGDFGVATFSPIVMASVTATTLSSLIGPSIEPFTIPTYKFEHPIEFVPYITLGLISGFVATLFIEILYLSEKKWEELKIPFLLKPALGGLLTGLLAYTISSDILSGGYPTIQAVLEGRVAIKMLLILAVLKIIATSLTLGSGGSGGVFAPSLFIGACIGGAVGEISKIYIPTTIAPSGAYAMVGMAALVGAATHAPITAIIIIFELTQDYNVILPLMISTIIATATAQIIKEESIYTQKLKWMGIKLKEGREEGILNSIKIAKIVNKEFPFLSPSASIPEIINLFLTSKYKTFPVIEKGILKGIVRFQDIGSATELAEIHSGLVIAEDIAIQPIGVKINDSLNQALRLMTSHGLDLIPVLKNGKVLGIVTQEKIIDIYTKELAKLEIANTILQRKRTYLKSKEATKLAANLFLKEIDIPEEWIGKTLRDINARQNYGIEVILIKRNGQELMPNPDRKLLATDSLFVIGPEDVIKKLQSKRI